MRAVERCGWRWWSSSSEHVADTCLRSFKYTGFLLIRNSFQIFKRDLTAFFRSESEIVTKENEAVHSHHIENKDQTYLDTQYVTAHGGHGGAGCISFFRSIAKGRGSKADGGNGGKGGDVILRATGRIKSLSAVPQILKAQNGRSGTSSKRHGKSGTDLVVDVPLGTAVSRIPIRNRSFSDCNDSHVFDSMSEANLSNGEQLNPKITGSDEESEAPEIQFCSAEQEDLGLNNDQDFEFNTASLPKLLVDLVTEGQRFIVARGGQGGRGNYGLVNRRSMYGFKEQWGGKHSRICHSGQSGERTNLFLELKHMADIALVGLPNVGKSSLLRALTAAKPAVASYAFTTISPQLGSLPLRSGEQIILADVPGLIEGAHSNIGLGHRFLRHIERASVLAIVVAAQPSMKTVKNINMRQKNTEPHSEKDQGAYLTPAPIELSHLSPLQQIELVRHELKMYNPSLLERPWFVILNKIDLLCRPKTTINALQRKLNAVKVLGASANGGKSEFEWYDTSASYQSHNSFQARSKRKSSAMKSTTQSTGVLEIIDFAEKILLDSKGSSPERNINI